MNTGTNKGKSINDLLILTEDSGETVVEGFKTIAHIIKELETSKIVLYLSYPGGLRLQVAIAKYREEVVKLEELEKEVEEGTEEGEVEINTNEDDIISPEDALSEEEKSLIYAAYLMS